MPEPTARRPYMPGYGIVGPEEGSGLLPWTWAEDRLVASHDYWVATTHPDGRPNVTPVWGVWARDAAWFSSSPQSRKAKNIAADPRVTLTTDNPLQPVIVEGVTSAVTALADIEAFTGWVNAKYETDLAVQFFVDNARSASIPVTCSGSTRPTSPVHRPAGTSPDRALPNREKVPRPRTMDGFCTRGRGA